MSVADLSAKEMINWRALLVAAEQTEYQTSCWGSDDDRGPQRLHSRSETGSTSISTVSDNDIHINNRKQIKVKGKGQAFDIAPQVINCMGAQVHGAH